MSENTSVSTAINGSGSSVSLSSLTAPSAKTSSAMIVISPKALAGRLLKMEPGLKYRMNIDADDIQNIDIKDGDLIITLENGKTIVLENFEGAVFDKQSPAKLVFETAQDKSDFFNFLSRIDKAETEGLDTEGAIEPTAVSLEDQLAEELAAIEPAAGPSAGGGRGGFGFRSAVDDANLNGLDDTGAINPTELQYNLGANDELTLGVPPQATAPVITDSIPVIPGPAGLDVDESDMNGGTTSVSGSTSANFGLDGPGTFYGNGAVNTNGLTFNGQPITVGFNASTGVYTGIAGGTTVFTLTINPDGSYDFVLFENVDHPDFTNHNDRVEITFGVTAEDADGDTDTDVITIGILDDGLTAVDDVSSMAQATNATITGNALSNDDLSEDTANTITQIEFNGTALAVPAAGSVSIDGDFGTLTINADGTYTYDLFAGVNQQTNVTDTFTYTVTDNDGDTSTADIIITSTPGVDTPSGEIAGGADNVCVGEDGSTDVQFEASLGANAAPNEFLTVTVTGLNSSWGTYDFNGLGTYNATTSTWTVTLPAGTNLNEMFTFTPAANSDVDLTGLQMTVTSTNPDTGLTASVTDNFTVQVDAIADPVNVNGNDVGGDEGATLAFNVTATLQDTDGSESITGYTISGVPNGFTLSAGTFDAASGNWILGPGDLAGLTITPPNASYTGSITVTVTAFNTETPTDGECDPNNNDNSGSDTFDFTWTNLPETPTGQVNGGVEDICVNEDGTVDVQFEAALGAGASPTEFLTVTITGLNSSWGSFDFNGLGTYNAGTGTWTYSLPAGTNLNEMFTFTPGVQHSDIDLTGLQMTVTATDSASGQSVSITDNFEVTVDAVADAPNANANNVSGSESSAIALDVSASLVDTDGSESISSILISGLPSGFTLSAGTNLGGGVWSLTPGQLSGLQLNVPNGSEGTYTLTVEVISTETPTDGECTTGNNSATSTDTFTVTIGDDSAPNITNVESLVVDETDINGGSDTDSGAVTASFGNDGAGASFYGDGTSNLNGLTSNGNTITVSYSNGVYTGTAAGVTVFTLTINSNGTYEFELFENVDHTDASNHNDGFNISFGVTAQDSDGDTDTGTININILDDGPNAVNDTSTMDIGDSSVSGNALNNDDFGEDGGSITPGTFVGTHGTLVLNADGSYTYTLNDGVATVETSLDPTSADVAGNFDNFIRDGFRVENLSGQDLNWVTGAAGGSSGIGTGGNRVEGTTDHISVTFAESAEKVIVTVADIGSNDVNDGIDFLVALSDGTTVNYEYQLPAGAPSNGLVDIELDASMFGGLEIVGFLVYSASNSALGTVSFLLNNVTLVEPNTANLTDTFTYTITDGDGDTDTGTITINVNGAPPSSSSGSSSRVSTMSAPSEPAEEDSFAAPKTKGEKAANDSDIDINDVIYTANDTQNAINSFVADTTTNDNTAPADTGTNVVRFPVDTGSSAGTVHTEDTGTYGTF